MKGKYLITSDQWFIAPDGEQYKSAWGNVEVIEDSFLGIKTNRNSSNWFLKIGSKNKHIIIAGCMIHFAVKCDEMPNNKKVERVESDAKDINRYMGKTYIYIAE